MIKFIWTKILRFVPGWLYHKTMRESNLAYIWLIFISNVTLWHHLIWIESFNLWQPKCSNFQKIRCFIKPLHLHVISYVGKSLRKFLANFWQIFGRFLVKLMIQFYCRYILLKMYTFSLKHIFNKIMQFYNKIF